MNQRDDISKIFYYLEAHTNVSSGRTVGRKIGVIQEIILHKYLQSSEVVQRRLALETFVPGFSGAAHKVEFAWYPIESFAVHVGDEIPNTGGLVLDRVDYESCVARLRSPLGRSKAALLAHQKAEGVEVRIHEIGEGEAAIDVGDRSRVLAALESKRVGAQRFAGSDKLGSGIQTIEKAKQAALSMIDIDRLQNGPHDLADRRDTHVAECLTFVALGNGIHWTTKDKQILGTYVDFTYTVRDEAIIRYMDFVAESRPPGASVVEHLMAYFVGMTKQDDDEFVVFDSDFVVTAPADEDRTLLDVLEQHLLRVNPV